MKENKYDDEVFYRKYQAMARSVKGLAGAGEWSTLKSILPPFEGRRVLDLGCGFGWHCRYAAENGAAEVIGVDISEKMIARAREINNLPNIEYILSPLEDIDLPEGSVDIVLSSLTFHYVESFSAVCCKIGRLLKPCGTFVFSVEHPVFTAQGTQDWIYGQAGEKLFWPVDNYFIEGARNTQFLGEKVVKYHRTLTTYVETLRENGFSIKEIAEPQPDEKMLLEVKDMQDELRRPMMLIISAKNKR